MNNIFTILEARTGGSNDPLKGFRPAPVSKPTRYKAGSDKKIDILRERLERGEDLWHEEDNLEKENQKVGGVPTALSGLDPILIGRTTTSTKNDYYQNQLPDWKKENRQSKE